MEPAPKEIIKDYWKSANPDVVLSILSGETQVELPETPEVRKYLKKINKHAREFFYYKSIVEQLCEKYNTTPDKLVLVRDKGSEKKVKTKRLEDRVQYLESQIKTMKVSNKEPINMKKGEHEDLAKILGSFLGKADQDESTQKLIREVNSST